MLSMYVHLIAKFGKILFLPIDRRVKIMTLYYKGIFMFILHYCDVAKIKKLL